MSEASPSQRAALRQYGLKLGAAYQIYDDCVDLFGSETSVGKSLGTDLAKGKLTLPVLLTLEKLPAAERREIQELILCWDSHRLPQLLRLLKRYDALTRSRQVVDQYLDEARRHLEPFASSASLQSLLYITGFLDRQTEALRDHH
jgi:octaprenyl-diphosphate synthase